MDIGMCISELLFETGSKPGPNRVQTGSKPGPKRKCLVHTICNAKRSSKYIRVFDFDIHLFLLVHAWLNIYIELYILVQSWENPICDIEYNNRLDTSQTFMDIGMCLSELLFETGAKPGPNRGQNRSNHSIPIAPHSPVSIPYYQ